MRKVRIGTGFSLVETIVVMAVIALILGIAIPNFRSMQTEDEYDRAEGALQTLKVAVKSYWRNHDHRYPANIVTALTSAQPAVIDKMLEDPWKTDLTHNTFGYIVGKDQKFGDFFIIFTKGPNGDTAPGFVIDKQRVEYSGSGRVVSNAAVAKR